MFDDDNDQYGFWRDEPTRPLERLSARLKPAGPPPMAPTRRPRPVDPQVGRRQHSDTQQLPVVATSTTGDRRPATLVDPLLRRVGALAVAVALCVPVAMALRNGDERSGLRPDASTVAVGAVPDETPDAAPAAVRAIATETPITQPAIAATEPAVAETAPATEPSAAPTPSPAGAPTTAVSDTTAPDLVSAAAATEAAAAARAPASVAPTTTALVCAKEYEVVAGDYWILIAEKVGVSLKEVLAANRASATTAIYPGRSVCLPANASAPTTAAPATTAAPTTTAKPTTTVKVTTTTAKPTTTSTPAAAAPTNTYTRAEVETIIRQVWPDDLEDEAVRIATRESNLVPTARNYCCFGLFQMYYSVHRAWLAQMGVTSAEQLYDPLVNAYVAYGLYLRSGSWAPWNL